MRSVTIEEVVDFHSRLLSLEDFGLEIPSITPGWDFFDDNMKNEIKKALILEYEAVLEYAKAGHVDSAIKVAQGLHNTFASSRVINTALCQLMGSKRSKVSFHNQNGKQLFAHSIFTTPNKAHANKRRLNLTTDYEAKYIERYKLNSSYHLRNTRTIDV